MSDSKREKKIVDKAGTRKAIRIFIVEDEIVIVRGLEDAILNLGYSVCGFALSGEDALPAIGTKRPDLVLVDIYLRGIMDGIELAKSIYSSYSIPVIYLTAYSNPEILERAKLTNPFGYILKPYREMQLKVNIELALEKHREDREKRSFLESCRETIKELGLQLEAKSLEIGKTKSELELATRQVEIQKTKLDELRQEVQEVNTALYSLSHHIARTREELEMEVAIAIRTRVFPVLKQLQSDPAFQRYRIELDMLSMHMNRLSWGLKENSEATRTLSTTELRIAALIKNGLTGDEIAAQLFISTETVKTHRRNIRKKLGLQNSHGSLANHLKAQSCDATSTGFTFHT
jgi:DNA-binding NarL/FixJ family response regulator